MALCSTVSRNDFLSQVIKPRLLQENDLLFDYDNLRACLDPTNEINDEEPAEKAENKVLDDEHYTLINLVGYNNLFNYKYNEGFIFLSGILLGFSDWP